MGDADDEFIGAANHLVKVKAAIAKQLKNTQTSDVDILSIFGCSEKKTEPKTSKSSAKKPSPPKVQKITKEELSPVMIDSDCDEDAAKDIDGILISSEDEEIIETVKRKTKKENKNRVQHFRMKEYDNSFNEDQKILSYLDEANQKDFEDRMKERNEDLVELDQNCEFNIKVRWNYGSADRYRIRQMQTFKSVFQTISEKHKIPVDKIMLEFGDDQRIRPDDTPDGLGVTVATIITGYALKETVSVQGQEDENKDKFEIKVQFPDRRAEKMSFNIKEDDKFSKLYCLLAEKLELPMEKLRLQFEGDLVEQEQTAEDLDLESGDVMDCIILS